MVRDLAKDVRPSVRKNRERGEALIADIRAFGAQAEAGRITLYEAFKKAHDLEDLLLERRIFEILSAIYKGQTSSIMRDLADATRIHSARIKVKLDERSC